MGVLRTVAAPEQLPAVLGELVGRGYNRIAIYLPGSREHSRKGLRPDVVLVRAWVEKGEVG